MVRRRTQTAPLRDIKTALRRLIDATDESISATERMRLARIELARVLLEEEEAGPQEQEAAGDGQ